MSQPFRKTLDLTSRAQQAHRAVEAQSVFAELDTSVPPATPDTLGKNARRAFDKSGWPSLMPVQVQAIPHLTRKTDLVVQSKTGSGKTGAFLLPLFDRIAPEQSAAQALVLTPTRELAVQIHSEFNRINPLPEALRSALVYGGVGYAHQIAALKGGAHIVIGTPGRILDHLGRRVFSLKSLRVLIFDEADEMLSLGFYPAMVRLKQYLPDDRQSCMFSATIPPKVRLLGREFLRTPSFMGISGDQLSVETIEHRYVRVQPMDRERALIRLLEVENPDSAIIFANTRRDVDFLVGFLKNYGFRAGMISGAYSQHRREAEMKKLRQGRIRMLVATDVAARGIDVDQLSHVIQYNVPFEMEVYIHRTGRTARAGNAGVAITLASMSEEASLSAIVRRYNITMEKHEVPDIKEAAAKVAQRMTVVLEDRMRGKTRLEKERLSRFVPMVESLAQEEPELMAMLVDELYQAHLQQPAEPPPKSRRRRKHRR
ncbi:MAG: DEAD/DEAH box helicase [Bacteroidota bacterium]|nr:DEAD/DEAH box helicase [Bacteroidota bacterium]